MLLDVIRSLYQYNAWANHRILIATSELTPEQFLAQAGSSYSSIRETLIHAMSAEWIWLSRWKGTSPSAMLEPTDFPKLQSPKDSLHLWGKQTHPDADGKNSSPGILPRVGRHPDSGDCHS